MLNNDGVFDARTGGNSVHVRHTEELTKSLMIPTGLPMEPILRRVAYLTQRATQHQEIETTKINSRLDQGQRRRVLDAHAPSPLPLP
jgi:hypothetical protein